MDSEQVQHQVIHIDEFDAEVIVRKVLTVEDVYDHLLHNSIFVLLGGRSWANIAGIPELFLEELRWRFM